jgi:hypothetical protein
MASVGWVLDEGDARGRRERKQQVAEVETLQTANTRLTERNTQLEALVREAEPVMQWDHSECHPHDSRIHELENWLARARAELGETDAMTTETDIMEPKVEGE